MGKGFGLKTQTISIKERKIYRHFLDKLLQVTEQGFETGQLVYSLLETNLEKLNDVFAEVLRDLAASSLPNLTTSNAQKKAKAICIFSYWLREFSQGDKNINLEIAIAGYQSTLQIYTYNNYPLEWGNIHYNLGLFYRERYRGILADNLEQAIKYFKKSLKIFNYETFPEQWSRVNHNLGATYCQRIYGDKSENVENAITYFENALLISTKQAYPDKWLTINNDMAGAYASRIQGEKRQNIEKAISLCQEALQFCHLNYFPEKWAALQNNLGAAYLKQIDIEKVQNIEFAISCFEKALQVYTQENFLEYWAGLQKSLGEAYEKRILGNRSENLETAISSFEKALQVYTKDRFSEDWADIQKSLGLVYYYRELGNRSENIEKAIYLLEEALQVYTQLCFPNQWGLVQILLGEIYLSRIRGEKAENLEQALTCCQDALQIYTPEISCNLWAAIQSCLGRAYFHRIHGDRKDNLEKSIIFFERALQVFSREAAPEIWAETQNNLGNVYSQRIRGNASENQKQSILYLENSLEVYNRETDPETWAIIQGNLGVAYQKLIEGELSENIETAISYHQKALQIHTQQVFPEEWAKIQHNLGNAYNARVKGNEEDNLELALNAYKAALQIRNFESFPQTWANTQNSLGATYLKRVKGNKSENVLLGIAAFKAALKVNSPDSFPYNCWLTARNLGYTAFTSQLWSEAIYGYEKAINAIEQIRTWVTSEYRRQEIVEEAIDVYQKMVQACINAGEIEKAFEYAERSRSKRLVDLMASNDLYQSGEIPSAVKELLQQYEELQQQIDRERDRSKSNDNRSQTRAAFQAYNEAIASLETEKQQVWEQIRRLDPVLAGEIQVNPLSLSEIQNLIDNPTTAILSFYTTDNDTHIFVLRQNQITLHTCTQQGLKTLQQWIFDNWLLVYVNDNPTWGSQIDRFLGELAQRLQLAELISQHLEGIEELILVPHLLLHQIPFAALPIANNQYLGDKFLIRYTPSCQILEFCQQRDKIESGDLSYGTVEDATDDLPCASFEGEQLAKLYNIPQSQRLRGSNQATKANYRQLAEQVQVLHCCHHAESCLDNPLASYLKLGDSNITLGELMTPGWRLPNLSDVFLSCCETNLGIPGLTDDILTLSTGFLCAGARSVVSTLWEVDDLATALFSVFYYQHRQQGKSRPEALRQAQIKLREMKKEELLSREDIQEFFSQVAERWKEAKTHRKHYPEGSATHLKWEREYRKYCVLMDHIYAIKHSALEYPFSHPRYWSAFICQGLQ